MKYIYLSLATLTALSSQAAPALLSKRDLKKAPILISVDQLLGRDGVMNYRWVCAEKAKSTLKARCDESPAEGFDEATGALELQVDAPAGRFDYGLRHAVPTRECRKMLRKIRKIQKENLPYCILGDHIGPPLNGTRSPSVSSVFFLLKSPQGYVIDMDF